MAKGQIRGNREMRKPKKDKSALTSSAAECTIKATGNTTFDTKK